MAISVNPGPDNIWIDGTPVSKAQVRAILDDIISDANATFTATDANIGKIFSSRQLAVDAGQEAIPGSYGRIITQEGTALVLRGPGQSTEDPLFPGSYPQWGVLLRIDIPTSIDSAGAISLTNVAGTGDAVTADFPSNVGTPAFTGGKLFRITWPADSTIANPEITVAGNSRTMRDVDGGILPEGFIKAGRTYLFETVGFNLAQLVNIPEVEPRSASLGPVLSDGGRDLLAYGEHGEVGGFLRLYNDGLDFPVSEKLIQRLPANLDNWQQAGQLGVMALDRFSQDPMRPLAVIDGVTRKAIIISVYGQSLADVTPMAGPLFWNSPPMPFHALTLNDLSSGGQRGGLRGWRGVAAPGSTGLVHAREDETGVQSYGSAAFARLNVAGNQPFRVAAIRSSANGGQKLIGDSAGSGLWKDSADAYTQPWLNWTQDIKECHDHLIAEGYEVSAIYICFSHQEADWQTPGATYKTQFLDMKAEREALIATDAPGIPVQWFVDQAAGSGYRTGTYEGGAWPDRMAIVDAVNESTNMTMVTPRYWMYNGVEDGNTDLANAIHAADRPRIWQGETFGLAMHEFENGRPWSCPWPNGATIAGNDVVIDFDSLEPLVLDPTFCKVRPDMGFEIWDGTTATPATSVKLTGQRQVTCTFPIAPVTATHFIRYAYRSIEDGDELVSNDPNSANPNIWPLSTGALRDAWEAPSLFDPGRKLVRAALGFELEL